MSGFHDRNIFFLNIFDELPDWFDELSREFSRQGFSLIPINEEQVPEFFRPNYQLPILTVVNKFSGRGIIEGLFKGKFGFFFSQGKMQFFLLSSFRGFDFSIPKKQRKSFVYISLPTDIEPLVAKIIQKLDRSSETAEKWPGGRRNPLPKNVLG